MHLLVIAAIPAALVIALVMLLGLELDRMIDPNRTRRPRRALVLFALLVGSIAAFLALVVESGMLA